MQLPARFNDLKLLPAFVFWAMSSAAHAQSSPDGASMIEQLSTPELVERALEVSVSQKSDWGGLLERLMTDSYCGPRATGAPLLGERVPSNGCQNAERLELLRVLALRYQQDVESQRIAAAQARTQNERLVNRQDQLTAELAQLGLERDQLVRQTGLIVQRYASLEAAYLELSAKLRDGANVVRAADGDRAE